MEPSAVIPGYDNFLKGAGPRRPSTLTVSTVSSSRGVGGGRSPEPSPTRSRYGSTSESREDVIVQGPFMYVGPERKRFHAQRNEAPYPLPCGMEELSRMNMLHYVLYYVFDKRHLLAEFKGGELPKRVLDIGCGTGIWIHDVAKQWAEMGHTDAEFVGVDLVPIQTPMADVNVTYQYLNILTDELPFEDGYFDYVHIRNLAAGVPENCWLGDHQNASGVFDKALRVLRVGGYFEVMEANLLFSYFDTSVTPPRQLPPEMVFSKEDTIAPILSKVYTGRQHALSPTVNLGINPFPLSILPAQFTFLSITQLQTVRKLIPVARFNVPMIRSEDENVTPTPTEDGSEEDDIMDSVARVAGYIAAGETYSSLRPELIRVIKEQTRGGDAIAEFKRIEQRSHRRWLGMEIPEIEKTESIVSDYESVRKVRSRESRESKSGNSEVSKSSASLDGQVQVPEKGDAALDKVQLKKEVGCWWGRKSAD